MKAAIYYRVLQAIILFMVLAVSSMSVACTEKYQELNFTVKPLSEETLPVELKVGETLEGCVQVTAGGELDIGFWVIDPYGYIVYWVRDRIEGRHDFKFKAAQDGYHILHFDNSFSLLTSKTVIVKYLR
ncbi:emp24/gp25L/p24 family protein [Chloroflexota bacterium]